MKNLKLLLFCCYVLNVYNVSGQVSSCRTPNGELARCVPIRSCRTLYDAVLTDDPVVIDFLQKSQCGFDGSPLVCCGSEANYMSRSQIRRPDLLPNECGSHSDDSKILGGENTSQEEFPWTALLSYYNRSTNSEKFSCGGTLINNRYVVTAAHCVMGRIIKEVGSLSKVRLGEWNTDTDPDCYGDEVKVCSPKPIDVGVEQAIPHSEYTDTGSRYHDIALIRLNRAVEFTDYVRPVCLPKSTDEVRVGKNLTVVGWGRTETRQFSPVKLKLEVPVVSEATCDSVFRRARVQVQSTQLCAGGEKGKDSCNGDSGGPLLANRDLKFYLEGIVSFGADCGKEGWPGIYTKVSKYRDWIESNIRP